MASLINVGLVVKNLAKVNLKPPALGINNFICRNFLRKINSPNSTFSSISPRSFSSIQKSNSDINKLTLTSSIIKPTIISFKRGLATVTDNTNNTGSTENADTEDVPGISDAPKEVQEEMERSRKYVVDNYIANINYELLEDFPKWLEGLGLKAVAPCFEGKKWQEIIELDWEKLDALGVKSRGIRNRLSRFFWKVKRDLAAKKGIELPPKEKVTRNTQSTQDADTPKKPFEVDYKLLEDEVCWLHSFGRSYGLLYPYFQGRKWQEMIEMTEADLKALGMANRTVRKALLQNFRRYKNAINAEKGIPPENPQIETRESI